MNIKISIFSTMLLCSACAVTPAEVQTGVQVAQTTAKVVCTGLGFWDAAGKPSPGLIATAGLEALAVLCSSSPAPDAVVDKSLLDTAKALAAIL